jgi:hypothetical protein
LKPHRQKGEDPRIGGARYWAGLTRTLLAFYHSRKAFCFPVRYEDICSRPKYTLSSLLAFLGERWEDGVLAYDRYTHDIGNEAGRPAGTKGFRMSTGKHLGWPTPIRQSCADIVQFEMQSLGYTDFSTCETRPLALN